MNTDATIQAIAEELRNEPYHVVPFKYNCIGKSLRFKRLCHKIGVRVRVVISCGTVHNVRFKFLPPYLPMIHGWAELEGCRTELARRLDVVNTWGEYDIDMTPFVAVWI